MYNQKCVSFISLDTMESKLPMRKNMVSLSALDSFIIYYVMKYRINTMHIFHSRENIKTCIFTAVKIQDLIFSRERNRKIGTTFFLFFSIWSKGSNSLLHICFFSKENNYWCFLNLWKCKQKVRLNKRKSFYKSVCYN